MFSSLMSDILSCLSPCLTQEVEILLPDHNIHRESNDDQGEKENRRKLVGPSRNNGDKTKLDGEVATTKIKRESVETNASEEDMSKIVASEGEIKYHSESKCFLCPHKAKNLGSLRAHVCAKHFSSDLKRSYSSFMHGNKCGLCQETLKSKMDLVIHIGTKHGRLNELLTLKGLPKIAPNTTSAANEDRQARLQKKINRPRRSFPNRGKIAEGITVLSKCEICGRELENMSKFSQHMSLHFSKELKDKFSDLLDVEAKTCLICDKIFPAKANLASLYLHIGSVHSKVEEIMLEKGLKPLETNFALPISSTAVKKERVEVDEYAQSIQSILQDTPNSILLNSEELLMEESDYNDDYYGVNCVDPFKDETNLS